MNNQCGYRGGAQTQASACTVPAGEIELTSSGWYCTNNPGLSPAADGRTHGKEIVDEHALTFPKGSKLWQDIRFQGYAPEGVIIIQPTKKSRGRRLTAAEKKP